MKRLLIACCAALALGACAPTGSFPGLGIGPIASTQGTLIDEKALIATELAYNTAGEAYLVARQRGLLPAATLAQARAALIRSFDALVIARRAYDAGNADSFAAQAAIVVSAAAEAKRLVGQ